MDYIKYEKTYVMMEEENHSFANDEAGRVGGVIKIETGNGKGAIKADISNLLYSSIYAYKLIFFGRKRKNNIYGSGGHEALRKPERAEDISDLLPKMLTEREMN